MLQNGAYEDCSTIKFELRARVHDETLSITSKAKVFRKPFTSHQKTRRLIKDLPRAGRSNGRKVTLVYNMVWRHDLNERIVAKDGLVWVRQNDLEDVLSAQHSTGILDLCMEGLASLNQGMQVEVSRDYVGQ